MTPRQIVIVALRLLAIWLGIELLRALPTFFISGITDAPGYIYTMFFVALTVVVILVLWFFPTTIAGKILPSTATESSHSTAPDIWLAMGCSLIGLWILTSTIPRLIIDIYLLNHMTGVDASSSILRSTVYEVSEALIALWLILGGKGFRKLFRWVQNAGISGDV